LQEITGVSRGEEGAFGWVQQARGAKQPHQKYFVTTNTKSIVKFADFMLNKPKVAYSNKLLLFGGQLV